jgi:hypothetical protein
MEKRWQDQHLLQKRLGDSAIDFQQNDGCELFLKKD